MLVVIVCAVLLLAGIALAAVWGRHTPVPAPTLGREDGGRRWVGALRRYAWRANTVLFAAVVSGALVATGGGRLVMRVLALTSPTAHNFTTEAGFRVGRISAEETFGLFVFAGLPLAFLTAVAFALISRWLPRGRLGGFVFGLLLLAGVGVVEPLRPDNPDFSVLDPNWLAVALFSALVVLHGMLVAAASAWFSRRRPVRGIGRLARSWPFGGALVFPPLAVLLAAGAVVAAAGSALLARLPRRPRPAAVLAWGRAIVVVVALVGTPLYVTAVVGILQTR